MKLVVKREAFREGNPAYSCSRLRRHYETWSRGKYGPTTSGLIEQKIPTAQMHGTIRYANQAYCDCDSNTILNAASKSAMMSSISSIPTEMRTRSGVTPELSCSSGVSWLWVLEAGWMTSVLASPA